MTVPQEVEARLAWARRHPENSPNVHAVEVTGIPSGDGECWCLVVTEEEYLRVRGAFWHEAETRCRAALLDAGLEHEWRLYPNALLPEALTGTVRLRVEVEVMDHELA
jgi:hypothetical protein